MNSTITQNDDENVVMAQEGKILSGTVYRKDLGQYLVMTGEGMQPCVLSSRMLRQLNYPTADPNSLKHRARKVKKQKHAAPLAVGDRVKLVNAGDGSGQIVELLPRRNSLSRRAARPMAASHAFEQVVAANIDLVVAVFAAVQPKPKWKLLDRYLAAAEANELPTLVCITKMDLAEGEGKADRDLRRALAEYERIGYPVLLTSAQSGQGLESLRQQLQGRVSALVGKSGVGKTSLLNVLQPGLGQRVGQVSTVGGKGKHTTSTLEMFPLDFGGALVDTPGMREFGLWDISPDELAWCFAEMRPYIGECKFGLDCSHDEEPGCAVRQAVMAGQISPQRYQSYMRLRVDA